MDKEHLIKAREAINRVNEDGKYMLYSDRQTIKDLIDVALTQCSTETEQRSTISSTDNNSAKDVQEAIEWLEKIKQRDLSYIARANSDRSVEVNILPILKDIKALNLAITALRAYQPTGEFTYCLYCNETFAVDDLRGVEDHIRTCSKHPIAQYRYEIAKLEAELTALRQMRTEPCEFCSEEYHHRLTSFCIRYHTSKGETSQHIQTHYCPNCGRRLDGDSHD